MSFQISHWYDFTLRHPIKGVAIAGHLVEFALDLAPLVRTSSITVALRDDGSEYNLNGPRTVSGILAGAVHFIELSVGMKSDDLPIFWDALHKYGTDKLCHVAHATIEAEAHVANLELDWIV